jgi:hypothetical protein
METPDLARMEETPSSTFLLPFRGVAFRRFCKASYELAGAVLGETIEHSLDSPIGHVEGQNALFSVYRTRFVLGGMSQL